MLHHQVIFNFIRNRWGILFYLAAFTKYLSLYKKGPHYIWMCEAISDALQDDKWAWQKVSQTSYASVRHGRFRQQIRCNIARHLSYTHLVLALFSITSYSVTTACTNGAIRFSRIYLKWSFLFFAGKTKVHNRTAVKRGPFLRRSPVGELCMMTGLLMTPTATSGTLSRLRRLPSVVKRLP